MVVLALLLAVLLVWPWVARLGGLGLVLLGIADNSVIPLTGSMDVLTIWLAARHRDLWPYYAFMATVGAVLGGYITYSLGRKGGKQAIEHRLHRNKAQKVFRRVSHWGFRTVFFSAMIPPPFPLVPVLLAAGALQYSRKKFVGALAAGRGVRYMLAAGFGSLYGRHIIAFFSRYYKPAVLILVGLAVLGGILTLLEYLRSRRHRHRQPAEPVSHGRAA
jgi:membrane protein YqaA with SNARE-associated domain